MIRHLEHYQIDKKKWDRCLRQAPNALIYGASWYLDVVSPDWNALVEDDYTAVFPLTWRKKYSFHYLHQPFFTQQLGLFSSEEITEKKMEAFLDAIPAHYRLIEIQLNATNLCTNDNFKISKRITHHLDLNNSYEKIQSTYSENLKRNIKRADKNKTVLFKNAEEDEIIHLFKMNRGKDIATLGKKDYEMLRELVHQASKQKLVSIIGAKTAAGKLCAGTIFLQSDHEYIFLFSATNDEARKAGAMSQIIDNFIRDHAGEKMKLDFEGSMDKNLARFYKSFGSKEVVYLQIKKNNLPPYVRWIKK
jgi:hypothetical protein